MLYSTKYIAGEGIWAVSWVNENREETPNAKKGLEGLEKGEGGVFHLLTYFFAGVDFIVARGGLAAFSVGFLTRFGGISNV